MCVTRRPTAVVVFHSFPLPRPAEERFSGFMKQEDLSSFSPLGKLTTRPGKSLTMDGDVFFGKKRLVQWLIKIRWFNQIR